MKTLVCTHLAQQGTLECAEVDGCVQFILENNLEGFAGEILWQKLFRDARSRVAPCFWSFFSRPTKNEEEQSQLFMDAVDFLRKDVKEQLNFFSLLDKLTGTKAVSFDRYRVHLSAILLSQIPADFEVIINAFYSRAFKAFTYLENRGVIFGMFFSNYIPLLFELLLLIVTIDGDESGDLLTHCVGCDQEVDQCNCSSILENCHNVNK